MAIRQQHRSNETAESVFDYFKKNAAIDHIISDLDEQSSSLAITASSLLEHVPTVICTKQVDITTALELYHEDLPSPELAALEITCWKLRYEKMPADKRPATTLGLGELCLNLPVLCYASNSWKCNYYASEEAVLCSHYAQLCNGIYL